MQHRVLVAMLMLCPECSRPFAVFKTHTLHGCLLSSVTTKWPMWPELVDNMGHSVGVGRYIDRLKTLKVGKQC